MFTLLEWRFCYVAELIFHFYILVSLAGEFILQSTERETWILNQPQNAQPIFCLVYNICLGSGITELVGVINTCLIVIIRLLI